MSSETGGREALPKFLTPSEVATLLRKPTVNAVYTAIQRGQIPGVIRKGARILVDRDVLLKSMQSGGKRK